MTGEPWRLTAHEAHEKLRAREFSAVDLTRSVLERVAAVEPKVNAYITLTADLALEQAREADARFAAGTATPLTGIPVAVKDLIVTKGVRTTAGSRILENFVPPYDSHVYEQLRRAGVVMVGKANMDEFAMGSSTEHSAYGPSHNPWNLDLVPGGSSGGSAAAVAAGEALVSLGSDTGGSIRQPASLTGMVGFDPTYGRVSRFGIIAFGSSLDQVGPIGRDVEDVATMLDCISGHDPRDSTSNPQPLPDLRRDGLQGGVAHHPQHVPGGDGAHDRAAVLDPHHHVAGQQDAQLRLGLQRPVGEPGVAGPQDDVRVTVEVELGLHRGLHVDLGEHAEALRGQCLPRLGDGVVVAQPRRGRHRVGHACVRHPRTSPWRW